jgi:hypothetical protein
MATRGSFSIINYGRYFVFMTATAENSVSYKHVVTEGSDTFIACLIKLGQPQLR